MAQYIITDTTLEDIADAIRAKTGKSASMTPLEMPAEIASISGGGGTPAMSVVYGNGGGNTSSAYNSSVLDVGEVGNKCYYVFGGGGDSSKTFSIQGSQTGTSGWTTIESATNTANRITGITGNDNTYRYYRLHVNAGTATATCGYRGMMACIIEQ